MEPDTILFWGQSHAGQVFRMPDDSADKPKRGRPVGTRNRPGAQKPGRKPKPRAREKRVASLGESKPFAIKLSLAQAAKLAAIAAKWRVTMGEAVRRLIDRAGD